MKTKMKSKRFSEWRKKTLGEKIFTVINVILLSAIGFICLYPIIYILAVSLSGAKYAEGVTVKTFFWDNNMKPYISAAELKSK